MTIEEIYYLYNGAKVSFVYDERLIAEGIIMRPISRTFDKHGICLKITDYNVLKYISPGTLLWTDTSAGERGIFVEPDSIIFPNIATKEESEEIKKPFAELSKQIGKSSTKKEAYELIRLFDKKVAEYEKASPKKLKHEQWFFDELYVGIKEMNMRGLK